MSRASSPQPSEVEELAQKHPRKRRRVALACERCRDRKIKCDGVRPTCSSCRQRHQSQDNVPCTYQGDGLKLATERQYIEALHDRIRQLERGSMSRPGTNASSSWPNDMSDPNGRADLTHAGGPVDPVDGIHLTTFERSNVRQRTSQPHSRDEPRNERGLSGQNPSTAPYSFDKRSQTYQTLPENSASLPNNPTEDSSIPKRSPPKQQPESEGTISAMGAAAATYVDSPVSQHGFYGASSAISFFNQIQDTLSTSNRPTIATAQVRTPSSLGISNTGDLPSVEPNIKLQDLYLPPRKLSDFFLDSYWDKVHCLYPLIHKASFTAVYHRLWIPKENASQDKIPLQIGLGSSLCPVSIFYCGLNAMLALGCSLSDMPYDQRRPLADSFCQRSLDLALGNLLDNSSLALVQALFILGQYLQSTDHPTRCWNVVGLALRVAQGIGLYMDKSSSGNALLETEIKRRTWHACVLLDVITSMTLGRPALTSREATVPLPAAVDDIYLEGEGHTGVQPDEVFSENMFFVQTIKLYGIFSEVLTHVYKPWQDKTKDDQHLDGRLKNNIIKTVMDLEHELLDFKSNLPPQLSCENTFNPDESWLLTRQRNILFTRFLHLKVLLYRPVFYQLYVQPRQNLSLSSQGLDQSSSNKPVAVLMAERCARACIESAQALIDFVDQSSGTKSGGAWWYSIFYIFTSAMILILAETQWSSDNTMSKESVEESWQKCLKTLERLSSKHIRAKTCAEILAKLREQAMAPRTAGFQGGNAVPDLESMRQEGMAEHILYTDPTSAAGLRNPRPLYENAVEFYDPLLQDVMWQQPDGQLPWDLDDDWWQGMLERP
ncbi:hypothetical protein IFR05_010680 [Cadophora sp. M221]|nr:hypothetical protein IFR05_010680 [Cadophora sp. M221]